MSQPTSDEFLSGQGVPVALQDVETELIRLWGPAAERAGGPDVEQPHVTRIALANLVLERSDADAGRLERVLDEVTSRYPSRAIVLCRGGGPGRQVTAEVSALCQLPAHGLPQVCSERIVLRAGPDAADLLPGAVRPLLEADLPFVLWWTDDPRRDEVIFRDLGDECSRLILDLPDPEADPAALKLGLDPTISPYARDTAWFGLTRWRELIASFFDPPAHVDTLKRIDTVTIQAATRTGAPPRLAAWLAGWLAGQLDWRPVGRPEREAGRLVAQFQGPEGPITVTIETETDPSLETAQLRATTLTTRTPDGPETFRLRRDDARPSEMHIDAHSPAYCALPRLVHAPRLPLSHRVALALESSRKDPPFQKALPHTLWLLGAD